MSTFSPTLRSVRDGDAATPCFDRGCSQPAASACAYVDRSARSCGLLCCDGHGREVAGERFCLRHAGVMDALVVDPFNVLRKPDVDNRAPSLVAWVARTLEPPLQAMLARLGSEHESVLAEPLRPIMADNGVSQAWRRSWQLSDGHQPRLTVGLEVDEADDETVLVTVHTDVVRRDSPPWITARRRGEWLTKTEDERRRLLFYQSLLDAVAEAATKHLRLGSVAVPRLTRTA